MAGRPSASSWVEIARDIHGMILGVIAGMAAESPGNNAAGPGGTYALENLPYGSWVTPGGTASVSVERRIAGGALGGPHSQLTDSEYDQKELVIMNPSAVPTPPWPGWAARCSPS